MLAAFFSRQFLLFLLVGGVAALCNWLTRILLSLFMGFGWSVFLAYGVGLATAFFLNRKLVFPNSDKPIEKQGRDFIVINLVFLPFVWWAAVLLNNLLIDAGIDAHSEEISHAIALSLPALLTFLLYKFVAFRENWLAKE